MWLAQSCERDLRKGLSHFVDVSDYLKDFLSCINTCMTDNKPLELDLLIQIRYGLKILALQNKTDKSGTIQALNDFIQLQTDQESAALCMIHVASKLKRFQNNQFFVIWSIQFLKKYLAKNSNLDNFFANYTFPSVGMSEKQKSYLLLTLFAYLSAVKEFKPEKAKLFDLIDGTRKEKKDWNNQLALQYFKGYQEKCSPEQPLELEEFDIYFFALAFDTLSTKKPEDQELFQLTHDLYYIAYTKYKQNPLLENFVSFDEIFNKIYAFVSRSSNEKVIHDVIAYFVENLEGLKNENTYLELAKYFERQGKLGLALDFYLKVNTPVADCHALYINAKLGMSVKEFRQKSIVDIATETSKKIEASFEHQLRTVLTRQLKPIHDPVNMPLLRLARALCLMGCYS